MRPVLISIAVFVLATHAPAQNAVTPIKNPKLQGTADLSGVTNASTVRSQLGLGNLDNTSDATKNSATATLTNKTISGASNTISNLPASAIATGTLNDARLSSNVLLSTGVGTTYFPTKLVSGALNTWSADFAGQFLASTDGISWSLARAAGAGHAVDEAVCQNSNMVFHGVRLENLDISAGTGEMALHRSAPGQNVFSVQNTGGSQGDVSAINFRDANGQERGAVGSGPRGTGSILFPFTDAVYLESSSVIDFGVPFSLPSAARDIVLEQAHLNASGQLVFNQRLRAGDGGSVKIYRNATAVDEWKTQTVGLEVSDSGTAVTGALTAGTWNGNTISTGTGTLNLGSYTLTLGQSGTLQSGAYAAAFNPAVPGPIGGTTPAAGSFTTVTASDARNFPYDADVATYLSAVTTASGTISDFSARVAAELVRGLKQDGLWSSITDLHFPLGDFAACKVKLKSGSGSATVTTTTYGSGNWTEFGPQRGLLAPSAATVSSGITASTLSSTNSTLAFIRTNNTWGNGSNATFGVNTYSDYGFTMLNTNILPGYQFFAAPTQLVKPNFYTFVKSGIWAASTRASDVAVFFNGVKLATNAAASGALPSSDIRFSDGANGAYGGYVIGAGLTDSQQDRLNYWLTRATLAMGLSLTPAERSILFLGDSLTYGYAPPFSQITSPYFKVLQATKRLSDYNTASYNLGVSGQTAYTINSNIAKYQMLLKQQPGKNAVNLWAGTNDMLATAAAPNGSASGATALASVKSIALGLKSADRNTKVLVFTLFPSTTYVATGYSASNYNSAVTAFNSGMLADSSLTDGTYADGIVRLDNIPEFQDTTNTTYFSDGLHLTNAGAALVAARVAAKAEEVGALPGSSNAPRRGLATLVSGAVTVPETSVTARTVIWPQRQTDGGTVGASYSITRTAGTSFTITAKDGTGSTQTADTSTLAYSLVEP